MNIKPGKIIKLFFIFSLAGFLILLGLNTTLRRYIFYNFTNYDDWKIFPYRVIPPSQQPFKFAQANHNLDLKIDFNGELIDADTYFEKNKTLAFLIIRNDSLLFEKYYNGHDAHTWSSSFSMAKSFLSMMIGRAIEEGYIESINDPITKYLPYLKEKAGFEKVSLDHLLRQTSGIRFREEYYSPFSDVAKFYYGPDLIAAVKDLEIGNEPGKIFQYHSGNTQLLGLALREALHGKELTQFFYDRFWVKLKNEDSLSWSTDDDNKIEKTYCCVNAVARDFAKLGRLMLNEGKWDQTQIISENWFKESTNFDTLNGSTGIYKHQWWKGVLDEGDYAAQGLNGQYIYLFPNKNLMIIRLGDGYGDEKNWMALMASISKTL